MASILDRKWDSAQRLIGLFESANDPERKERILRDISSIAHDFYVMAEELDTWATDQENEMVDRGEI